MPLFWRSIPVPLDPFLLNLTSVLYFGRLNRYQVTDKRLCGDGRDDETVADDDDQVESDQRSHRHDEPQ